MGWKDELHEASFRGVQFECTSITDSLDKSVAIHQAPYSNAATVEDMGNNAARISVQAIYTGDDYLTWTNALLAALDASGPAELMHPVFGVQFVQVMSRSVQHDAETPDFCSITIEFVLAQEERRELFIPVQVQEHISPLELLQSPANALQKALEKLQKLNPTEHLALVKTIRNGLQTVRTGLGLIKSTVENILSPASWATGLIDDVSRLVNFDFSISALSQWRDVIKRVDRFKNVFNTPDSPKELQQLWRATHAAIVVETAQVMQNKVREELHQQQINRSLTTNTVNSLTQQQINRGLASRNTVVSMTPIDLAVVRQQVRQVLQEAIRAEREYGSLDMDAVAYVQQYKYVADQVHLQIQSLIETRPPITTTVIRVPCNMHWLAHHLYADRNRADEIARLNPTLQNSALLLPGMEITIYAQ